MHLANTTSWSTGGSELLFPLTRTLGQGFHEGYKDWEKEHGKENIKKAIDLVAMYGPPWARKLLANPQVLKSLILSVDYDQPHYGACKPRTLGGRKRYALNFDLELRALAILSWKMLIGTVIHELRHVALFEAGKQPKGTEEEEHPIEKEEEVGFSDDDGGEDDDRSNTEIWRDTQAKEADQTIAAAEDEPNASLPWEPGKAGDENARPKPPWQSE